jgi:hypothetical protein
MWDLLDPGSGIRYGKIRIRDPDKHPGAATLKETVRYWYFLLKF